MADAQRLLVVPPNCSEVGAPQVEFDSKLESEAWVGPFRSAPEQIWYSDVDFEDDILADRGADPVALFADVVDKTCGCV